MEIANPLYDSVFKFLMEDRTAASLIIGAITGFDIEDIELRPTEIATDAAGNQQWTVYRLDLAAKIRTSEGPRLVLVEVQKAKYHTDILRFRRYLGGQYASATNYEDVRAPDGTTRQRALPIFTIYILGHVLERNTDIPVIRVNRSYTNCATGELLAEKDEFIESLTHDSAVIQVPALRQRRRTRLEQILGIFDQAQIKAEDHHLLRIDAASYPAEVEVLIRRLMVAVSDEDLRQKMIVEDEIVTEFKQRDRREEELRLLAEEERRQKDVERALKEVERALKDEERRQKDVERTLKEAAEEKARAALAEVEELRRLLALARGE